MTWAQLTTAVNEDLGPDGTRRGIETLRIRAQREAIIDLQRYIRAFRTGHTTTYNVADLTTVSYAHAGTLPDQAKPKAFYIISTGDIVDPPTIDDPNCVRNRLEFVAWENRRAMICNSCDLSRYVYSVSPYSRQFLVHPLINDETKLLLVWDGLKMDFVDADVMPTSIPEWAAEALAAFIKFKILSIIDRRPDLAAMQYNPVTKTGVYAEKRLALYREQRESQSADDKDEEYGVTSTAAPTPP